MYVADGPQGLQVIDLSTPSKPTIVGSYKASAPVRDVAVAGSLVLVATGGEEVLIPASRRILALSGAAKSSSCGFFQSPRPRAR
jgi:hypothetical protein